MKGGGDASKDMLLFNQTNCSLIICLRLGNTSDRRIKFGYIPYLSLLFPCDW